MSEKNLVAILGVGKGSWGHIARIISEDKWDSITMVTNEWGQENFTCSQDAEYIIMNNRAGMRNLIDLIKEKMPKKKKVSLCLASGTGKEHTAVIAMLRELKIEYNLVALTDEGTTYF